MRTLIPLRTGLSETNQSRSCIVDSKQFSRGLTRRRSPFSALVLDKRLVVRGQTRPVQRFRKTLRCQT